MQEEINTIERNYRPFRYSAYQLVEDFGDDPDLANQLISQIRTHKSTYKKQTRYIPIADPNLSWVHNEVNRLKAERDHAEITKTLERVLYLLSQPKDAPTNTNGVTEEQIARARQVPITNLIEFNRGFAPCSWHSERTASLHILPNTEDTKAHCHGVCKKTYDAISAYQLIHNCNFVTAVRGLQ